MRFITVLLALFLSSPAFGGIKSTDEFILPTEGITVKEKGVPTTEFQAFAQVLVQDSRLFGSQFQAQRFCQSFDRRGLNNHCRVRSYSSGLFGADYRFVVRGQGRTRLGALNAILDFLQQFNLILDQVQLLVDFFSEDEVINH